MREFVELTPGNLLGQKIFDPAFAHDLRQGGRIAENVGNPHVLGLVTKLFLEVALAVEDLPDQRFARDEIAIRFDPHGADGFPLAALHRLFDSFPNGGIVGLHPGIVLRLRAHEDIFGILFHVIQRGGERPGAFADRFTKGPQPGGIDVRVTDG